MRVRILGSAAGGGVPQWNCRCPNCAAVRAGSPDVQPRTQSSVAVSADGASWFLLNVSPDIRQQIIAFPALGPSPEREGMWRGTSIAGCVLTDAELDHVTGLLLLREGPKFNIGCTSIVREWLKSSFPVELILACFSRPGWSELALDATLELHLADGTKSGLRVRPFQVDPHVPRYVKENSSSPAGSVIGLVVEDVRTGGRLVYAPCLASLGSSLRRAVQEADCVLIDGTFWDDEEPVRCGVGTRTAQAMGHLPVSGASGSLNWLSGLNARHRVYVHINNTNPMLNERGAEHRLVNEGGVRVGADGDAFEL